MRTGITSEGNIYDHGWMCDGEVEPETMMIRRDPVARFISGYRNFRDKRGWWMGFAEFVGNYSGPLGEGFAEGGGGDEQTAEGFQDRAVLFART